MATRKWSWHLIRFQNGLIKPQTSCSYCQSTGQREVKRGSRSGIRSRPDAATARLDNRTANGESQACTFVLGGKEWVKNLVCVLGGQSYPRIGNRDQQLTILGQL